jgi:hypothetical protein
MSCRTHGPESIKLPTDKVTHTLHLYSAAALAAGVGLLALAQPAEGSVVVTKTNLQVNSFSPTFIDLNNDGVNDVALIDIIANYDHSFYASFAAAPVNGGKIVGGNRGPLGPYASALAKGANIGPSAHFSSSQARGQIIMERFVGNASATTVITYYGKWVPNTQHYLGVKFLINGQTHYGWIQMSVVTTEELGGTVTEYAYETVANKKIGAGATSDVATTDTATRTQGPIAAENGPSLGMLAVGADALPIWRREQNQCVQS